MIISRIHDTINICVLCLSRGHTTNTCWPTFVGPVSTALACQIRLFHDGDVLGVPANWNETFASSLCLELSEDSVEFNISLSATDSCGGGVMFLGCLSGVCPVSLIPYKPMDGVSPYLSELIRL